MSSRPRAARPWTDLRFVLGILLIVASVAGVWLVVTAARQTAPVYAAARTLVAGTPLVDADLEVVDVALGRTGVAYLAPGDLSDGAIVTTTVRAGELVPRQAMADAASARTTSVVVRSSAEVPASVVAGTVVELWSAPQRERGVYDDPRILVADATVVTVTRDASALGGGAAALEVTVPRAEVPAVLSAVSAEAAISVVPAAGAAR